MGEAVPRDMAHRSGCRIGHGRRPQAAHGHDKRREPHDEEHVEPAEGVERHQSFGLFHNSACTKTGTCPERHSGHRRRFSFIVLTKIINIPDICNSFEARPESLPPGLLIAVSYRITPVPDYSPARSPRTGNRDIRKARTGVRSRRAYSSRCWRNRPHPRPCFPAGAGRRPAICSRRYRFRPSGR